MRLTPLILFLAFICACSPATSATTSADEALLCDIIDGARLFDRETFGGNGRTCSTCHILDSHTDLAPADVQAAFVADPTGPLFRSLDSDDGVGSDYSLLLRDATVRIPFVLPPGVWVEEPDDGVNVQRNPDGTTTVWVRRSTPTVENIALEDHIMWDGREGSDLEHQAQSAVTTHAGASARPVTADERSDIATFQEQLFSGLQTRLYAATGRVPVLPAGRNASEQRGRGFFVSQGPIDATHRGLCATCHSGPMLNTTDAANPLQPPGERFSNNFVSETNGLFGNQYPELTYHFPHPVFGERVLRSSDPGRLLVTGDPCEVVAACIVNPGSTISIFRISTLWGVASTAPYFHDNSAADLEEVMDVYGFLFAFTADALDGAADGVVAPANAPFVITPQDRADILAYMRYAFR